MNCCRLQTHRVLIGPLSRSAARVEHRGHGCLPSCFRHAFAGPAKLVKAPQALAYGLQKWEVHYHPSIVMTSFHILANLAAWDLLIILGLYVCTWMKFPALGLNHSPTSKRCNQSLKIQLAATAAKNFDRVLGAPLPWEGCKATSAQHRAIQCNTNPQCKAVKSTKILQTHVGWRKRNQSKEPKFLEHLSPSQATNSSGKQGLCSEDFRESFLSGFYPKLKFPRVVIAIYFNTFEADQKPVVPQQSQMSGMLNAKSAESWTPWFGVVLWVLQLVCYNPESNRSVMQFQNRSLP